MRIGFIGTQGTGKTTILNALHEVLPHYEKCNEVTRWVKSIGFSINEDGDDLTQELILMKHITNLQLYDNSIADRTLIDGYVYTDWLNKNGKVSTEMVNKTLLVMNKLINEYDLLFYLPIEFSLEDDGVRSTNNKFREEIDLKFREVIASQLGTNIITLTGTVQERLKTILQNIKEAK